MRLAVVRVGRRWLAAVRVGRRWLAVLVIHEKLLDVNSDRMAVN